MFGTSYSGFNSLQVAAERPPALKAICAIYASDDRWTDDVHWRGARAAARRPRRLLPLHDPDVRAAARAGGVGRRDWRAEWQRRLATNEPWVLTWLRENRDGAYWRARVAAARGRRRVRPDRVPDDDRRRLGRRLPQQHLPHRRGAGAAGVPHRLLAGPWAHADPATAIPGPRIDLDAEMVGLVRPLAARVGERCAARAGPGGRVRPDLDPARARPGPARGLLGAAGRGRSADPPSRRRALAGRSRWRSSPTSAPRPGSTAPATCRGGSPATSARTTPRSLTWDWAAVGRRCVGQPRGRLRRQRRRPGRLPVGQALRRLPRRHLGAGLPGHPRPGLPRRVPTAGPAGAWRGVRRRRRCSTPAPTSSRPASRCGSRSPARTGPTPSRPPRRSP